MSPLPGGSFLGGVSEISRVKSSELKIIGFECQILVFVRGKACFFG
jgi:hypothetical protein